MSTAMTMINWKLTKVMQVVTKKWSLDALSIGLSPFAWNNQLSFLLIPFHYPDQLLVDNSMPTITDLQTVQNPSSPVSHRTKHIQHSPACNLAWLMKRGWFLCDAQRITKINWVRMQLKQKETDVWNCPNYDPGVPSCTMTQDRTGRLTLGRRWRRRNIGTASLPELEGVLSTTSTVSSAKK